MRRAARAPGGLGQGRVQPVTFIRTRLTYANVMATIAVFLALGGTAWAVRIASTNSVVSRSIRNGQVKVQDLATEVRRASVLAFAEITPGGGVRHVFHMGSADVTHPTNPTPAGVYCFKIKARNAQVTPGFEPGAGSAGSAVVESDEELRDQGASVTTYGCPTKANWVVITSSSGTAVNAYFEIVFF